jgi:hypothetical protein
MLAGVKAGDWTSLEVAKLAIGALIPVMVAVIGFVLNRALNRVEQAQWAGRKLVELRLEVFNQMAGPLNDLLCFFSLFGDFQDITPPEAIERKRELDKLFFTHEYLMTEELAALYGAFMGACFKTYTEEGEDAQLRARLEPQRRERRKRHWEEEWTKCFVQDDRLVTGVDVVEARYKALNRRFAADIGLERRSPAESRDAAQLQG